MFNDDCSCTIDNHVMCAERVPIFSSLSKEELIEVVSLIIQKKYERGTQIISEGVIPENFIIVSKGKLKVCGSSQDGKEQIMYILTHGDFFGARNLIYKKEADYNVQAMDDTVVCSIARLEFQELLIKFPRICIKIMEILCERLEKMESLVRKISPKDVDSRINMLLLELSRKYGRKHSQGILIALPMSREEMANYIGVARETVSRKLSLLRDEGVIDIIGNKRIIILNEKVLENSI